MIDKKMNLTLDMLNNSLIFIRRRQYQSKVGTNANIATRTLVNTEAGIPRPIAVTSLLNLILIILVNLLVLGLINLA
jgi:hypothetical protein